MSVFCSSSSFHSYLPLCALVEQRAVGLIQRRAGDMSWHRERDVTVEPVKCLVSL